VRHLYSFVGACVGAALLAACGGSNSFSSSTPASVTPQTASQVAYGRYGSHRAGKNAQMESVLHSFGGSGDGANPQAGLINVGGTLYGTTGSGGAHFSGTVYNITTSGAESVVYSFAGSPDGIGPAADLTDVGDTLYGTTHDGGANGDGTVFKITCRIARCTESVLHSFAGRPDGDNPESGLTKVGDTLYGTTRYGGAGGCRLGCGSVFKITTSGAYSLLYSFTGSPDGAKPSAGLTDVGDTLYGTTPRGGANDKGTVYKITTSGAESVVYSFAGSSDGAEPRANVTNVEGTLYGTTALGGANDKGTVYKITAFGTETVLYSFAGGPTDGEFPSTGLTNVGATLYGTTPHGGASGPGVIFAFVKPSGPEFVLHSFKGAPDGGLPESGLTDVGGTLYGTTFVGGNGPGTVFSLSP
jgi:uncharacterized repeat protein (TIGR03803 family)